jgi:hypothetical protein
MKDGQIRSILRLSLDIHAWRKAPAAHKGMVHVAKIMAATAVPAFADATLIPRVKADLAARTRDLPTCARSPWTWGRPSTWPRIEGGASVRREDAPNRGRSWIGRYRSSSSAETGTWRRRSMLSCSMRAISMIRSPITRYKSR